MVLWRGAWWCYRECFWITVFLWNEYFFPNQEAIPPVKRGRKYNQAYEIADLICMN